MMTLPIHKVCVVGPGALGGMMVVVLARAGFEVSTLARPARAARIKDHGTTLQQGGNSFHVRTTASSDPGALGLQDLVIVMVKSQNLHEVAQNIMALCGPTTPVLFLMNGVPWWFFQEFSGPLRGTRINAVDPDGFLARAIPLERIVWGTIECAVEEVADETVRHTFLNTIVIGRPSGDMAGLDAVAAVLRVGGYNTHITDRIRDAIWFKLQANAAGNPVSALTGATGADFAENLLLRDLFRDLMKEIRDVGEKLGLGPGTDYLESRRDEVNANAGKVRSSMLQDMNKGRPLELDAILAAPVEIADKIGVPVPFAKAVLGLLRARVKSREA